MGMHRLCCDNRIWVSNVSYVFYKAEERHDYLLEMCIFGWVNRTALDAYDATESATEVAMATDVPTCPTAPVREEATQTINSFTSSYLYQVYDSASNRLHPCTKAVDLSFLYTL